MSLTSAARRMLMMSGTAALPRELVTAWPTVVTTVISREAVQPLADDHPTCSAQGVQQQASQYSLGNASRRGNSWHLWPAAALLPIARSLHSSAVQASSSSSSSGDGNGGSRGAAPQQPVSNPLQAALQAAAEASGGSAAAPAEGLAGRRSQEAAAAAKGRRRPRLWMWYDEADEREERRKERQREKYDNAGTAYLMMVPQSMKKMNRILRLVRGLPYPEAVAQCQMVPHKAAKYVLQALEHAYKDATENKGLNGEQLIIGAIFVTKGMYTKESQPMGKGMRGRMYTRTSHLRVALNEARGRKPSAFSSRVVAPLMSTFARSPGWLAAAAAGREGLPRKQRFAYRLEV